MKLDNINKALVFYAAVALVVMAPLLLPGYIFATDMVPTPTITLLPFNDPGFIFTSLLWIIHFLIPVAALQKIILLSIFFASGYGMHLLMQNFKPAKANEKNWLWACYFAGLIFAINPFIYSRFIAGQWIFLIGYTFLPWIILAFIKLCKQPNFWHGLIVALLAWFAISTSLYIALPLVVVCLILLTKTIITNHARPQFLYELLKWSIIALAIFLLLCSPWLLPAATGRGGTAQIIKSFNITDQSAFKTNFAELGVFGNLLSLQGFWADSANLYLTARDTINWWLAPIIAMWLVILFGIFKAFKINRGLAISFLAILLIGVFLAAGSATPFTEPVSSWLFNHIPFFAGYRESQKIAMLIVLTFAYFGGVAVFTICQSIKTKDVALAILFCIPPLCAPLIFWGGHGQLKTSDYPVEWQAVNDRLDAECQDDCKTLFLPWHMYMRYGFADKVMASPAPKFFGSYIIASNDPELKGATPYTQTDAQKDVQNLILPALQSGDTRALNWLKNHHINYILLAKENDYKKYDYLNHLDYLKNILETPTLSLYQVINQ